MSERKRRRKKKRDKERREEEGEAKGGRRQKGEGVERKKESCLHRHQGNINTMFLTHQW